MAKLSSTFSSINPAPNARRAIYRIARLGTHPLPKQAVVGDAFAVVASVKEYEDSYEREQANIPFLKAWADSWADRAEWRS